TALDDRPDEIIRPCSSAGRDDRDRHGVGDRAKQGRVEARLRPVALDRRHEQLPGALLRRAAGPRDGVESGRLAAALHDDLPGRPASVERPGVDRDDHGLAAKAPGAGADQLRVGDCGGVQRDLVGAGSDHVSTLVDTSRAAADRERDERPACGPLDDLEQRAPTLRRGRDVEEDELICAFARVALRELRRIALVHEVDEPGALHDAAVRDVEAGDDADPEHQAVTGRSSRAMLAGRTAAMTFASSRSPSSPLRSGWNWTPSRRPLATADTNGRPWVVVASTTPSPAPSPLPAYECTKETSAASGTAATAGAP